MFASMVTIKEVSERQGGPNYYFLFFLILNKACQDTAVAIKNLKENSNTFADFLR